MSEGGQLVRMIGLVSNCTTTSRPSLVERDPATNEFRRAEILPGDIGVDVEFSLPSSFASRAHIVLEGEDAVELADVLRGVGPLDRFEITIRKIEPKEAEE